MEGSFACPDCGCQIRLSGVSPGRQVRCDWCRGWVEVPYLPRAEPIARLRSDRTRRARRRAMWVWLGVGMGALGVTAFGFGARSVVRSQWRSAQAATLAGLVDSSHRAEAEGQLGAALAAAEAAVAYGEHCNPPPPGLADLRLDRARLARREAESQLDALERPTDDPGRAVGQALTLLARVERDPALAGLGDRVDATLDRLRLRWVAADSAAARRAEEDGRPYQALDLAMHQHRTAGDLPPGVRARWQADATELARRVIARNGALIDPIRGRCAVGSEPGYDTALRPVVAAVLRDAGYLPRPKNSPWDDLWQSLAPYRLTLTVSERQDETYLSSANRLTRIDASLVFARQAETLWRADVHATTTVPLPGISAYQASRAAASSVRSHEFERLLYDNARANLNERLAAALRNLPRYRPGGAAEAGS